jgi:hypothetical protein
VVEVTNFVNASNVTITSKFTLDTFVPGGNPRTISVDGDFLYTNTGKLIILVNDGRDNHYIQQYDYATGRLEIERLLDGTGTKIFTSIFQYNLTIYVVDNFNNVYSLLTTEPVPPSTILTLVRNSTLIFNGASNDPEYNTVILT